jgi:tetratricopeptide (TPR) repeat protein
MAALFRNLFGRGRGSPAAAVASSPGPADPSSSEWLARGNAALAGGEIAQAEACYRRAVAGDTGDALARLNLGFACLETGKPQEARTWLAQALERRRPDQAIGHEVHFLLARACLQCGETGTALSHCEAAVAARPDFGEALEMGVQLLARTARYEEALAWAGRLPARPAAVPTLLALAQSLYEARRHADALAILERLLALVPDHLEALEGRANVLFELGRAQDAIDQFQVVLPHKRSDANTLSSLAAALIRAGRFEEAVERTDEALRFAPTHLQALGNQGRALIELLRVQEAAQLAERGLLHHPADPDLRWIRAMAHLLAGRLEQGWPDYEVRWHVMKRPQPTVGRPRWNGRDPLRGRTIILLLEQGLGDALQVLRYIPMVAAEAAQVLVELPPPLMPLATKLPPNCRLVRGGETFAPPDFELPLLSLPLAFRTSLATLPAGVSYLEADAAREAQWAALLPPRPPGGLRIGLVWSGNPEHLNDHNRSIPLAGLHALQQLPHQFVSLQPQVRESDAGALAAWPALKHFGAGLRDFADTAAIASQLDLVISVDTSVAHLAGALGRPVWILLPYCPDWRWLLDRDDSPWYPSARLFRQRERGGWPQVVQQLVEALAPGARPHPSLRPAGAPGP